LSAILLPISFPQRGFAHTAKPSAATWRSAACRPTAGLRCGYHCDSTHGQFADQPYTIDVYGPNAAPVQSLGGFGAYGARIDKIATRILKQDQG
jgi:hypothetical protein